MSEKIWIVDNEPSKRYPIYTRGNVGEVFPDVVAPLSWTVFGIPGSEQGWRDAFVSFGVLDHEELDPDQIEILGCFGGYAYLNVSIARIFGVRTPGMTPELVDYTIFGEQSDAPPYEPREGDESPEHTERIAKTMEWVFTATDLPELREDRERVMEIVRSRPDLASLSNEELVGRIRDLAPPFRDLFSRHIYISYAALLAIGTVSMTAGMVLGDPSLAMRLVAGIGEVDSAAPSFAMWDLGRLAAETPEVNAAFDEGPDGLLDRLQGLPEAEPFLDRFRAFLDEFGSRGPNEWESRSPTWETQPSMALGAIDRMRLTPAERSPQSHFDRLKGEREKLTAEVLEKLSDQPETTGQLEAALNASKLFSAGRERSKTTIIRLVHEIRMTARELGRRMVDEGIFESWQNVGMLQESELDDFLADPASWRDTILDREVLYARLQNHVPPFVIDGEVPPLSEWEVRSTTAMHEEKGAVLTGIPGCPGEATGRARVVTDTSDPGALEPGDVLVAPITDPSWTPLFVPASAVVVDVGAQLSHAVIVSRELGIPCVVSVTDATRRIPDGAEVRVDGTNGTVTIL